MGKHTANKQAEEQDQAYAAGQQSMAPPPQQAPAAPASSGISSDSMQQLAELGRLHEQGILTDEEFAQQKAKILGP